MLTWNHLLLAHSYKGSTSAFTAPLPLAFLRLGRGFQWEEQFGGGGENKGHAYCLVGYAWLPVGTHLEKDSNDHP